MTPWTLHEQVAKELSARVAQCREHYRRMLKKAVQQGRSERRAEAYPLGYVEGLSDARTKLADFFSILLEAEDIEDDDAHQDAVVGKRPECMALHKREKGCDHNPGHDERYEHPNPERQVVVLLKDAP